ncbi:hypothetical protein GPJ56_009769 [Histomonas meleagridis]|uniref:uncharacterized protein n=1 Tax=Histomonas meleagridis TaxID=135588 RepID=UPI0035599B1A|nr:hypothetical protein GPJ56_009769 [Histomonas meleagridis]KAH0802330.1 hypothetical protein GO595_004943 [Histomonas meleagridis]
MRRQRSNQSSKKSALLKKTSSVEIIDDVNESSSESEDIEQNQIQTPTENVHAEEEEKKELNAQAIRRSLLNLSQKGVTIRLVKNALPRDEPRRYRVLFFDKILDDAFKILKMPSYPKKLYDEDGNLINSFDQLKEQQLVYVSAGERFVKKEDTKPKKKKLNYVFTKRSNSDSDDDTNHNKNDPQLDSKSVTSKVSNAELKKQQVLNSFHRMIATSSSTSETSINESISSVFSSLTNGQKKQLSNLESIQLIHNDTQLLAFQSHLIRTRIATTPQIMKEVQEWSIDLFNEISPKDIKFVITGPRQSGKTTMLFTAATTLLRKLQISQVANKYLLFPLNFESELLSTENPFLLQQLLLTTVFDSIRYSNYSLLPYVQPLQQWFSVISSGGHVKFPTILTQYPHFNFDKIKSLAKDLSLAVKDKTTNGLDQYVQLILRIPKIFAESCGFLDVIYIIDSFEYCNVKYLPNNKHFSTSTKEAVLPDLFCNEMTKSMYIISCKSEEQFLQCFKCQDATFIDSEGIVKNVLVPYRIAMYNPNLLFTIDNCMGCCGFISRYIKVCELFKLVQSNASIKKPYSMIKAKTDLSRLKIAKRELKKLLVLLYEAGCKIIKPEMLNEINCLDDSTTIKIIEKEINNKNDNEEEEEEIEVITKSDEETEEKNVENDEKINTNDDDDEMV